MMLSKPKIKFIQSLHQKKFRQMYGNFIVEGDKIVRELLMQRKMGIEAIYALETWVVANATLLKPHFSKILTVSEAELKQISALTTPNQVLAVAKKPSDFEVKKDDLFSENQQKLIAQNISLYLDAIQDPGNMGTILRIADWFSIPYVFCSPDCVEVWSPKVVQASMGACLRVDTYAIDFFDLKKLTPSVSVMVAALKGQNIFTENVPKKGIVVIGNEGNGVRPEIFESADFLINIPGGGGSESLNAAVATGIICAQLIHRK